MRTIDEYRNTSIDLSLNTCLKEDYCDKRKLRRHNKAMDMLLKLTSELSGLSKESCQEILSPLLAHEDARVALSAAAQCLRLDLLELEALTALIRIEQHAMDSMLSFSAKILLQEHLKAQRN